MKKSSDYKKAKKRVEDKKGFFTHLIVFLFVNGWFFLQTGFYRGLNMNYWWTFALGMHYISVFGFPGTGVLSKDWEEEEIEREMEKMQRERKILPPSNRQPLEPIRQPQKRWSEDDLV